MSYIFHIMISDVSCIVFAIDVSCVERIESYKEAGLENIVIFSKLSKISDIFDIFNIYIYQAFAHTLLKLYEIYYHIIVCMCVHCILGEVLLLFTLHCRGEVHKSYASKTHRPKIKT